MTIRATGKVVGLGSPFVYQGKFVPFAGHVLRGESTLDLEIGSPLEVLVHDPDFQDWIKRSWAGYFAAFTEEVIGNDVALLRSLTSPAAGCIGSSRPPAPWPHFGVPLARFSNAAVAASSAAAASAFPAPPVASSSAAAAFPGDSVAPVASSSPAAPAASATALPGDSAAPATALPDSFENMSHRPRETADDDDEDDSRLGAPIPLSSNQIPAGWGGHGRTISMPASLPQGFMAPTRHTSQGSFSAAVETTDDDDTIMPLPDRARSNSTMGGMTDYSGSAGDRRRLNQGYTPTSPSPSMLQPRSQIPSPNFSSGSRMDLGSNSSYVNPRGGTYGAPREDSGETFRDNNSTDSIRRQDGEDFRDSVYNVVMAIREAGNNAMATRSQDVARGLNELHRAVMDSMAGQYEDLGARLLQH
ncbi:hypothetical protein V498_00326 [Pseudogymnoascus sp. VKM F-4517 (FW-2822)]|nr:hypothetical protein V498_00326 [Pseudogymnoascus sp. VKM F-4517 (FW-2822)]